MKQTQSHLFKQAILILSFGVKKNLPFLFLLPCLISFSQASKYPVISVPVERNGITLTNPWTGGMNAPQFSPIDLNSDGINDLFVFDRGGDRVFTFINDGAHSDTAFHYAPQYEKLFPPMKGWALIRDYNHDNIPDIFTYQTGEITPDGEQVPAGIKVYKGSRNSGILHFDVVQYCLNYLFPPSVTNLWVNGLGIPAIVDVNRDGDLDVLTFNVYGAQVDYYENLNAEQSLPSDSFIFTYASPCWGHFYHGSGNNLSVSLNISCKGGDGVVQTANSSRHAGAALSAIDNGSDHDVDLLVSGAGYDYMILLNNSGDSSYAIMGWVDTLFPSCNSPARLPFFPNAYEVDGDNDGFSDLLFAPNFNTSSLDKNNVFFYRKIPGNTCAYQSSGNDSFLVHSFMDFGTDSKGVFFDHNSDGLMDIIVGNYHVYNPSVQGFANLALYENTGTNTAPAFREITNDYSGLSWFNLLAINPAFGDLDGDGKKDMLVGDKDGQVHFFKNTGGSVASFPSVTIPVYDSIDVGGFAAPYIYDVNGDSLPDLVIGKLKGTLSYYWNFGTSSNPLFHRDSVNADFGNVDVSPISNIDGNSQPFIMRDSVNDMHLYVGSQKGSVFEYLINPDSLLNGTFTLLDSNVLQYYSGMNVAMQSYDLNNDGKMEYLVGNSLGGLQLFSESVWDSSVILAVREFEPSSPLSVFPNPAKDYFTCLLKEDSKDIRIEIFNLLGVKLNVPFQIASDRIIFSSTALNEGIYIIRISSDNWSYSQKIFIQR